jgi:hypothetical protein
VSGRAEAPALRIVRGDPTDEEIAALTAVLAVPSAGPASQAPRHESQWAAPQRLVRRGLHPTGWWDSSLP